MIVPSLNILNQRVMDLKCSVFTESELFSEVRLEKMGEAILRLNIKAK